MKKVLALLRVVSQAFDNLKANDPIRMAAATAFFSFFALPPIVIILSQVFSGLLNLRNQQVSWQLFHKLANLFGYQSARQLQDISRHLQHPQSNRLLTSVSVFILLVTSTTLFTIIKNSLNQLWSVKTSTDRPVGYLLLDKVLALGIIMFSGVLVTISVVIHRLFRSLFLDSLPSDWATSLEHHSVSVLLLTVWFAVVFKYLPDIRIRWQAVWVGALVTGLLVELGEQVLDRLLIQSPIGSLYGTAGAIILILLFVFYSSLIFYFGASFTRYYAQRVHLNAEPGHHAVAFQIREVSNQKPGVNE